MPVFSERHLLPLRCYVHDALQQLVLGGSGNSDGGGVGLVAVGVLVGFGGFLELFRVGFQVGDGRVPEVGGGVGDRLVVEGVFFVGLVGKEV